MTDKYIFPFPNENKPLKKTSNQLKVSVGNVKLADGVEWFLVVVVLVVIPLVTRPSSPALTRRQLTVPISCPVYAVPGPHTLTQADTGSRGFLTPAPATSCTDTAQSNTPLHSRSTIHCIFRHYV